MPKLYFRQCDDQSQGQSQGMLQAELPREECIPVVELDSATQRAWKAQNGRAVVTIETVGCKSWVYENREANKDLKQ